MRLWLTIEDDTSVTEWTADVSDPDAILAALAEVVGVLEMETLPLTFVDEGPTVVTRFVSPWKEAK